MKKVFRKIFSFIFISLMLFSAAIFGVAENFRRENDNWQENSAQAVDYETSGDYVNNLLSSTDAVESQYNLSDYYPLINENQKDSDFCWIYASLKSLETALMIQKNEYYNFSEMALSYLYYVDRLQDSSGVAYSVGGNFQRFAECYQKYGLALESDVSNNIYSDINSSTYQDYDYIKDLSSFELNSYFKPYQLGANSAFANISSAQTKIGVIKRFVKKYGALFSGIEGGSVGCFYADNSAQNVTRDVYKFYSYSRTAHKDKDSYVALSADHAITIVGWNDDIVFGSETGAFLVMNSWGFEEGLFANRPDKDSIRLFYVPYSYTTILDYTAGFICSDESETISIESASESTFTTDFLKDAKDIDNFFSYDDEIWVNYKLNLSSFDALDVKISSGSENFNGRFAITTDDASKTIKVKLNKTAEFYGGYYTISFYNNESLVGKRGIYIYSGTEINYLKGRTESVIDTYLLDNAFANADNVITINVASTRSDGSVGAYFFEFNRSPINSYNFILYSNKTTAIENIDSNKLNMQVSNIEIISSTNEEIETRYSEEELQKYFFTEALSNEMGNAFRYQIGIPNTIPLSTFDDCLVRFTFSVNSIVYENCTRDFVINMFVSDRDNADSTDLYSIFYELDGGKNSDSNPTKYPIYSPKYTGDTNYDETMTEVELAKPTREGFVFVNWYLDENFTQLVTKLDSSLSGNVTLYAKWESLNYNYFDLSLVIDEAFNYDKSQKSLSEDLVYGDSIVIAFGFTPVYISSVDRNDYTVQYYFYGTEIIGGYLGAGNTQTFNLNFPDLESGDHIFTVKVKVVYGLLEIVEETSIAVSVAKKQVVFGFSELSKVYNGTVQKPSLDMSEDFYAEDYASIDRYELFNLTCGGESKNAGTYNFYVESLKNKNYSFDADADSSKCTFEITKREISLEWKEYNHTYDGENHFPEYTVINIVAGDSVNFLFNISECKNAGNYKVNVLANTISNKNYTVTEVSDFEFEIKKAKIKVIMHNTTDRIQTKAERRKTPDYTILGNYHSIADLDINIITEASVATESGTYAISCSILNENYEAEVQRATYVLTGYYNVYYLLSNGDTYTERVEEGEVPVGVTKEQLGVSRFSKISYSDDYEVTGEDLYVEVEYTDYTVAVYLAIVVAVSAVIGFIVYLKKRESKVR